MASSDEFRDQASRLFDRLEDEIVELFEAEVKESERRANEAEETAVEHEAEAREADARARAVYDLLRDLAEDRHRLAWLAKQSGHGTSLRTCPDRLCSEAAELFK